MYNEAKDLASRYLSTGFAQGLLDRVGDLPYDDGRTYGLRFDSRVLCVGDEFGASRHNLERTDERDFPDFDDPAYAALPMLDGTSCYHSGYSVRDLAYGLAYSKLTGVHWYIVVGDSEQDAEADGIELDNCEVVILDATVLEVIF